MSFFDSSSDPLLMVFQPKLKLPKVDRATRDKQRRKVEEHATKLHPRLGDGVKTFNRLRQAAENPGETKAGRVVRAVLDGRLPMPAAFDPDHDRQVNVADLRVGDHIWVDCGVLCHHGIYVGGRNVIHIGTSLSDDENTICQVSVSHFRDEKKPIYLRVGYRAYDGKTIKVRAANRLGERGYDVVGNNCEHFAEWCKNDQEITLGR